MKRNLLTLGLLSLALAACGGGDNGENGLDGKDGKDGASCTITNNEDGSATITCPDGSSFTVKNGEKGQKGDAGSDSASCTVAENDDGSATITCPDGSSFTVKNGQNGDAGSDGIGCTATPVVNEDGLNGLEVTCGNTIVGTIWNGAHGKDGKNGQDCHLTTNMDKSLAVVCPADGSSFIIRGNTDNYLNYCKMGYFGSNCEKECTPENDFLNVDECSFTDTRDNNVYKLVKIGRQLWMAENLKATTDINGNTVPCYANTNEDSNFLNNYGCLYAWREIEIYGNVNNICPKGWRLPTKNEYDALLILAGSTKEEKSNALRSTKWSNGLDTLGFGALPAGYHVSEQFNFFKSGGYFWSSTHDSTNGAYSLAVKSSDSYTYLNYQTSGNSVRCIKDLN